MKRIKHILIWLSIFIYLGFALSFVKGEREEVLCNKVNVNISDSLENSFVRNNDIIDLIDITGIKLLGMPITLINTENIETILRKNPYIKEIEIFRTIDGQMHIEVNQRSPIVRIIDKGSNNYYIDRERVIMPISKKYASHVLVANGNITSQNLNENFFCNRNNKENGIICDVFTLAEFINSNDFWNSQIQQIYVNEKNEFELAPRVGPHVIFFGSIKDYEDKFKKLELLYNKGFRTIGWNDYLEINLKYKNQVICTKR